MQATIEFLVPRDQATPERSIGPELEPASVDVPDTVPAVDERATAFDGTEVPVALPYEDDGDFEAEVGVPSDSSAHRARRRVESDSVRPQAEFVADLAGDRAPKVAEQKLPDSNAYDLKCAGKEPASACVSLGIAIDGDDPREFARRVDSDVHGGVLETNRTETGTR